MTLTLELRKEIARKRKERITKYITQDPPVPFYNIMKLEGMSERPLRLIIKDIEKENGISYLGTAAARDDGAPAPGLSDSTARFRSRLAVNLFRLRTDPKFGIAGREDLAPRVGINPREQIRAEQAPYRHDWSLGQIERLARELGEEPRDFILKCLTT